MTEKLQSSPDDKHKALHGEKDQADYLVMAKGSGSPQKRTRGEKEEIKEESPIKAK